ncbi:pentapeptide repeat-containing protein [Kocuria rosea]|uniref:pentapeptide repeat-containing protein n=1 Tax=Kocuria rosea TaxID=1275 RepID=UPI00203C012D|nr:pentapeptide repeat-containing protein [Kocuria rosea]
MLPFITMPLWGLCSGFQSIILKVAVQPGSEEVNATPVSGWLTGAVVVALIAALVNITITLFSTHRADQRSKADRRVTENTIDLVDRRERETDRHSRFATVVEQLASKNSMVRMGGLYALSALADEWDQEARRLVGISRNPGERYKDFEHKRYLGSKVSAASKNSDDAKSAYQGAINDGDWVAAAQHKRSQRSCNAALWQERLAFRSAHTLRHRTVIGVAKSAIGQRDACIALLCAYLRDNPVLSSVQNEPNNVGFDASETENCLDGRALFRPNMPDHAARTIALNILKDHLSDGTYYPWPGELIDLTGAYLEDANLHGAYLNGACLNKASMVHAKLDNACLVGARMSRAKLTNALIRNANLSDVNAERVRLRGAKLSGSILRNANLVKAKMEKIDLIDADLENARLNLAHIEHGELWGASLARAKMVGTNFSDAQLVEVDLRWATLISSRLEGAALEGANLGSPLMKDEVCVTSSGWASDSGKTLSWDARTNWPEGFSMQSTLERQNARYQRG